MCLSVYSMHDTSVVVVTLGVCRMLVPIWEALTFFSSPMQPVSAPDTLPCSYPAAAHLAAVLRQAALCQARGHGEDGVEMKCASSSSLASAMPPLTYPGFPHLPSVSFFPSLPLDLSSCHSGVRASSFLLDQLHICSLCFSPYTLAQGGRLLVVHEWAVRRRPLSSPLPPPEFPDASSPPQQLEQLLFGLAVF